MPIIFKRRFFKDTTRHDSKNDSQFKACSRSELHYPREGTTVDHIYVSCSLVEAIS